MVMYHSSGQTDIAIQGSVGQKQPDSWLLDFCFFNFSAILIGKEAHKMHYLSWWVETPQVMLRALLLGHNPILHTMARMSISS